MDDKTIQEQKARADAAFTEWYLRNKDFPEFQFKDEFLKRIFDAGWLAHIHASPSGGGQDDVEVGWLIEQAAGERGYRWLALSGACWTIESTDAIRFARKLDAEMYIAAHGLDAEGTFPTEHQWSRPLPEPPKEEGS